MIDENIKLSLNSINDELIKIENKREKLIKESRKIIILCNQCIVSLHRNKLEESEIKLKDANNLLQSLKENISPDLKKYLYTPEQEIVEATVLNCIVRGIAIPRIDEIGVSSNSYLTGLLDAVGEIKRMIFDQTRIGNSKKAEDLFVTIQDIYNEIYPFAVFDNIVSGLRRKLDVSKILIENSRELITEESRRSNLISYIEKLSNHPNSKSYSE
ncbi:MAG: RNA-binding protein [Nitrososphaeraceae archaeon]